MPGTVQTFVEERAQHFVEVAMTMERHTECERTQSNQPGCQGWGWGWVERVPQGRRHLNWRTARKEEEGE